MHDKTDTNGQSASNGTPDPHTPNPPEPGPITPRPPDLPPLPDFEPLPSPVVPPKT